MAKKFGCATFWQQGDSADDEIYIGEQPQLNFGGRSIFWSGLIPALQRWELDFFPASAGGSSRAPGPAKRDERDLLHRAGEKLNQSRSMGHVAQEVVKRLKNSSGRGRFLIEETPRAMHQPYLKPDGTPANKFFTEPTGVFNTAELLINQLGLNQLGLADAAKATGPGSTCYSTTSSRTFVTIRWLGTRCPQYAVRSSQDVPGGHGRAGRRLDRKPEAAPPLQHLPVAAGSEGKEFGRPWMTDHPTTDAIHTYVDGIGGINLEEHDHAKIIFYSRGLREQSGEIRYPFNVEMNINHEYWHLRKERSC